MEKIDNSNIEISNREILLTRTINAPRERVFRAWTDPKQVIQWWGPKGFTTTSEEIEVKPGGTWRFTMHGPDGRDYGNKIVFTEITPPEKLVYKHSGVDSTEHVKFTATIIFENLEGRTKLIMKMVFEDPEVLDLVVKEYGAIEGGEQHLDRLGEFLEKSEN